MLSIFAPEMYGSCIDILRDTKLTKLSSESGLVADVKNNENKIVPEAVEKLIEETSLTVIFQKLVLYAFV